MKNQLIIALALLILTNPFTAIAQDKISVAVAANFIAAFQELALNFEIETKIKVEGTFSSTGNLYNSITNGAPYDLFLSADEERPALLSKDGFAEKPFIYARGQVILWSANKDFCKPATWPEALQSNTIRKIAIANPLTAPYGAKAKAALQKAGLRDALQGKLVYAQDIAQSFRYASTGAVDAGFCSLSVITAPQIRSGCFYRVPEAENIMQTACILKRTKNSRNAEYFAAYLNSAAATKIKMKYGYF
jgi:molybdate transport system substrate-binding protein